MVVVVVVVVVVRCKEKGKEGGMLEGVRKKYYEKSCYVENESQERERERERERECGIVVKKNKKAERKCNLHFTH